MCFAISGQNIRVKTANMDAEDSLQQCQRPSFVLPKAVFCMDVDVYMFHIWP